MASRKRTGSDRDEKYFGEDSARRAAGRLFEEDPPARESAAPTYADFISDEDETRKSKRPPRRPEPTPDPEDERRLELEREDYVNTTIRSTRDMEKRLTRGDASTGNRYRDFMSEKPAAAKRAAERRESGGPPDGWVLYAATVALFFIVCAFLVFKINSVNHRLKTAETTITASQSHEEEYQRIVIEVADLRDANKALQETNNTQQNKIAELTAALTDMSPPEQTDAQGEAPPEQASGSSGQSGGQTASGDRQIHTVAKGDTLWGVAMQYYGDGNQFQKILAANGLQESDVIMEGMKLVIPK